MFKNILNKKTDEDPLHIHSNLDQKSESLNPIFPQNSSNDTTDEDLENKHSDKRNTNGDEKKNLDERNSSGILSNGTESENENYKKSIENDVRNGSQCENSLNQNNSILESEINKTKSDINESENDITTQVTNALKHISENINKQNSDSSNSSPSHFARRSKIIKVGFTGKMSQKRQRFNGKPSKL